MKILILITFLIIPVQLPAPGLISATLLEGSSINPYKPLFEKVSVLESLKNPFARHIEKNKTVSIGIVQISQAMVTDFNRATGKNYKHDDCFRKDVSMEIFFWHCSKYNPWEMEKICRIWNGGGKGMSKKSTLEYWNKIKNLL